MVDGASSSGYKFAARNVSYIGIENFHTSPKSKEIFEVLNEFPFDSTRKRMSLIVRRKGETEI